MKTNWAVFIEGMCLPWEDGLIKSEAEAYAKAFKENGVMSAVQQMGYTRKSRQEGCSLPFRE